MLNHRRRPPGDGRPPGGHRPRRRLLKRLVLLLSFAVAGGAAPAASSANVRATTTNRRNSNSNKQQRRELVRGKSDKSSPSSSGGGGGGKPKREKLVQKYPATAKKGYKDWKKPEGSNDGISGGGYGEEGYGYASYPFDQTYHLDVDSEAFHKCYNLLETFATTKDRVYQKEYLEFLLTISSGELVYSKFADLPAEFKTLFYATACSSGYITVADTGNQLEWLRFFCQRVLTYTNTKISVSFEFSIKYLVAKDKAASCLSRATENMLLDHFGCSYDNSTVGDETARRLATSNDNSQTHDDDGRTGTIRSNERRPPPSPFRRKLNVRQRPLAIDDSSDCGYSKCPYTVTNDVAILDLNGKCISKRARFRRRSSNQANSILSYMYTCQKRASRQFQKRTAQSVVWFSLP